MNNFNNWTVDFGFDGSEVFKGMNAIETKAKRLFTKLDQIKRAETSGSRSGSLLEKIEKTRSSREQSVAKSRKVVKSPVDKAKELNEVARLNSELKLQDKSIQLIRLRNKLTIAGATESSSVVSKLDDSLNSVKSSQELLNKVTKTGTKEYTEFQKEVLRTNSGIKNLSAEIRDSLTELRAAAQARRKLAREAELAAKAEEKLAAAQKKRQQKDIEMAAKAQERLEASQKKQALRDEAASARKRKPEPVIPASRFNPLSDSAILSREFQIRNKINKLIEMRNKLDGQTSPEAKRLVEDLTSSIKDLRNAQDSLSRATNKNSKDFRDYERGLGEVNLRASRLNSRTRALTKEFTSQKFAVNAVTSSLQNMGRSYLSVFAAMQGASSGLTIGSDFQSMASTMLLASGSAEQAGENIEFITQMSKDLGVDLLDTAKSFAKFNVSAAGQKVPLEQAKADFMDLAISMRAAGLNANQSSLAMLGFQQMLAGPVIQGQEMNQVIDQMPQFIGAATKAIKEMGYETENYKDAIESGTVSSVEFVSKVTRLMREQAVETGAFSSSLKTITAQIGRLGTALQLNISEFFKAGFEEGFSDFLSSLTFFIEKSLPFWKGLGIILGRVFKRLASIIDTISLISTPLTTIMALLVDMDQTATGTNGVFSKILSNLDKSEKKLTLWQNIMKGLILSSRVLLSAFDLLLARLDLISEFMKEEFRLLFKDPFGFLNYFDSERKIDKDLGRQIDKGKERAKVEINAPIEIKVEGAGNPETAAEMVDKKIRKVFTDLSSSFE